MKWFCAVLAIMLSIPVLGFSQGQTPPPATSPSAQPATTTGPVPAATVPPAPAASPTVNPEKYVIGADDTLQVTVWKEPSFSGTFPVRPDGMISLVMLGDIRAAGRTPIQLGDDITQKLKKYIQDPVVSVVVMAVNSQKIFMVGEINHVGPIMLTPGMTPLQAIATAGGLTMFAHEKKIYILRGVQGKQQKIPFDYKKALKGDNNQGISLQPGDTVVVP